MKKIILYICAVFLISGTANASGVISQGEVLEYKVSFIGITLGHIKIQTNGTDEIYGVQTYKAKANMDSNPDIPFVELHAVFESWLDSSLAFSRRFEGHMQLSDGSWDFQEIDYRYDDGFIRNRKWIRKKIYYDSTYYTDKKYNDGLSLFFLARQFTKMDKTISVPTIMDDDDVRTIINFQNKIESVGIDAVDYNVRTIYFNGKAKWTGIYGLKGYFEGWFSDDKASVPIKAKMKLYVGSVKIELVKWKRDGWSPPRAD